MVTLQISVQYHTFLHLGQYEVCIELLTFLLYTVKGESDKAQLLITMAFCYLGKEI